MIKQTDLLLTTLAVILLILLLVLVIFGYSSFLSFVKGNVDLCQRLLNVLYCQLAVLYQVFICCQVINTILHLWWNYKPPTYIQNVFYQVFLVLIVARAILFLQITSATYLKYLSCMCHVSVLNVRTSQEAKALTVFGSVSLDQLAYCWHLGSLASPDSPSVGQPQL